MAITFKCVVSSHKEKLTFPLHVNELVKLNILTSEDSITLFDLVQHNCDYLRKWLPWVDAVRDHMDQENFVLSEQRRWKEKRGLSLGIWGNNDLIGVIGFNKIDHINKTAEIGYWIAENHQKRGFVTDSCEKLMEFGLKNLGITTFIIICATENQRSQLIPKRLGFSLFEMVRNGEWLYDRYVDHYVYKKTVG
jgi:ribosomal-protein-serine acetyltransferase